MTSIQNYQRRLERAALLHNEGDLIRATVGRDVYASANGDAEAAWQFLVAPAPVGLGLHGNTARLIRDMGQALVAIDDEQVWRAAGWKGVRALLKLPAGARKAATRKILKEANGTELGGKQVRVIVTHFAGRQGDPSAKRKPAKRKPAAEPKPPADDNTGPAGWVVVTTTRQVAFARELARLLSDPLIGPTLRTYVSSDVLDEFDAMQRAEVEAMHAAADAA